MEEPSDIWRPSHGASTFDHTDHTGLPSVEPGHICPPGCGPYAGEQSHNLQLTILYMLLKLPHFAHYNVVPSLTSRVQLCCIQYRMRGYGLISRANYRLVSHVQGARPITVTAGPVQVQYKIPCFTVFSLSIYNSYNDSSQFNTLTITTTHSIYNYYNQLRNQQATRQL